MAIINNRQARFVTFSKELNTKPSTTVPNQTLSIEEILRRFTNGGTVIQHEGTYSDTFIPEGIHKMDLVDLDRFNEELTQQRMDLTDVVKEFAETRNKELEEKRQKKKSEFDSAVKEAAEKLLKNGA